MTAIVITGDLLDADTKYIAHQTNCITQTAAHLAAAVFDRFPYADIYCTRLPDCPDEPGTIIVRGNGASERYVINMLGQYYPGRPKFPESVKDGHKTRQRYFFSCLKHMTTIENLESVAFPYGIGCGAAGGNWDFYHELINKFAIHMTGRAHVVIYKLP